MRLTLQVFLSLLGDSQLHLTIQRIHQLPELDMQPNWINQLSVDLLTFRTVQFFRSLEVTVFWLMVLRYSHQTLQLLKKRSNLTQTTYNLNRASPWLLRHSPWFPSVVLVGVLSTMVIHRLFLVSRSSVDMVHLHSLVVTYPLPTLQPTSDSTL